MRRLGLIFGMLGRKVSDWLTSEFEGGRWELGNREVRGSKDDETRPEPHKAPKVAPASRSTRNKPPGTPPTSQMRTPVSFPSPHRSSLSLPLSFSLPPSLSSPHTRALALTEWQTEKPNRPSSMHILHLGHVLEDKVTLQGASVGRGWSRSRAWSCGRVASRPAVLGGATAFGSVRLEFVKLTQYSFLTPPPPLVPSPLSSLFFVHRSCLASPPFLSFLSRTPSFRPPLPERPRHDTRRYDHRAYRHYRCRDGR